MRSTQPSPHLGYLLTTGTSMIRRTSHNGLTNHQSPAASSPPTSQHNLEDHTHSSRPQQYYISHFTKTCPQHHRLPLPPNPTPSSHPALLTSHTHTITQRKPSRPNLSNPPNTSTLANSKGKHTFKSPRKLTGTNPCFSKQHP